ncbi:MAG: ABC transporter permease, partial [Candidatus Njordarchaeales archaeon]
MRVTIDLQNPDIGYLVIFKCGTLILTDLFSPEDLLVDNTQNIMILKSDTYTVPEYYGFDIKIDANLAKGIASIYLPENLSATLLLRKPLYGNLPFAVLSDYKVRSGSQNIITNVPLKIAENLYDLNLERISTISAVSVDLINENKIVHEFIEKAKYCYSKGLFSDYYRFSIDAYNLSFKVYERLRNRIQDSVQTIPFFGILLLPFVFLVERLVFKSSGVKRIIILATLFILAYVYLYFVHIGFSLCPAPWLSIISLAVIILAIPTTAIIFNIFVSELRRLMIEIKGEHFIRESRVSAVITSCSTGIENMKKRKARTILILTSVILISIALFLFTSVAQMVVIRPVEYPRTPPYQGMYLRPAEWESSIGLEVLDYVSERFGDDAIIVPRAWLYTAYPTDALFITRYNLSYGDKSYGIYALLGLTSQDSLISQTLVNGTWFGPEMDWACILTQKQANSLGINPDELPTKVKLNGKELMVIGIVDDYQLSKTLELDGQGVTPWDQTEPMQNVVHKEPELILIMQYKNVLSLSGQLKTVSVILKPNSNLTMQDISAFFERFSKFMFLVGLEGKTYMFNAKETLQVIGWQFQIIPICMTIFILLNTMIASIYERKKEIFIYSAIGLSPLHVASMFLIEAILYSVLGGMAGYFTSSGISIIIANLFNIAIPIENFSSSWVSTVMGIVILATILSSTYPMFVSSRMVTPSAERRWKIPTEPTEREWEIPLPYVLPQEEADAFLTYLLEFINQYSGVEKPEFSVKEVSYIEERKDSKEIKKLEFEVQLPPYERGIRQIAEYILIRNEKESRFHTSIYIRRISGQRNIWITSNRIFIDHLRRQGLLWNLKTSKDKERYFKMKDDLRKIRR